MRILLLITDLQIGGTPTVVRELAIRLNAAGGANVEVACLGKWGPVADQLARAGVTVTAFGAERTLDLPRTVRRLARLIRQREFDTVFSFLLHANAVAAIVSRQFPGVRWLQSIQTTQPKPWWHWKLQAIAQHAAGQIVVPSESVARVAQDWAGVAGGKIVVIGNATSGTGFQPVRHEVETTVGNAQKESAHGLEARATEIGFIGRLDPIKRIGDLLQAMTFLDSAVHLHIFGEGAERTNIEETIARLKLHDRVTVHGVIADPAAALAQLDLLALPSQAEGFGLVLIEAMAAGVPVVATNVPGIRDVLRHGENGLLVPVAAPAELAKGIELLLENSEFRTRLTADGMKTVRERFSWEVVLPQYQKLLGISPE
ncbi:MAG TPA: glycosyltransferase family 4 protein [Tepidisphaeraceae bacterium]|jgi:glycosyltransferase involved in cell wall biosynthesis|nr:glycosyltransferase family 4 protein [Tepidisphaeraceae bacterium]